MGWPPAKKKKKKVRPVCASLMTRSSQPLCPQRSSSNSSNSSSSGTATGSELTTYSLWGLTWRTRFVFSAASGRDPRRHVETTEVLIFFSSNAPATLCLTWSSPRERTTLWPARRPWRWRAWCYVKAFLLCPCVMVGMQEPPAWTWRWGCWWCCTSSPRSPMPPSCRSPTPSSLISWGQITRTSEFIASTDTFFSIFFSLFFLFFFSLSFSSC